MKKDWLPALEMPGLMLLLPHYLACLPRTPSSPAWGTKLYATCNNAFFGDDASGFGMMLCSPDSPVVSEYSREFKADLTSMHEWLLPIAN